MKRAGLLHAELSGLIAAMGHGDLLVIGDAGLPVPWPGGYWISRHLEAAAVEAWKHRLLRSNRVSGQRNR